MRQELAAGKIGDLLKRIEASLSACAEYKANPFCGGNMLTVADLKFGHQMHLIASGHIEYFPDKFLEQFPLINKLQAAVYDNPKIKDYYNPPLVANVIWFTAKEGELDKFTQIYHDNPYKVITSHSEATLYTLGHAGSVQGTCVLWKNAKDRDVAQARAELTAATTNVKNAGLFAAPPMFRSIEVRVGFISPGKTVKTSATCGNMLRCKLQGNLEEFIQIYTSTLVPHFSQFPEHVVRLIGGYDKKENEWVSLSYYVTPESYAIVTAGEPWKKVVAAIQPFTAEMPQTTVCTLKHVWEGGN